MFQFTHPGRGATGNVPLVNETNTSFNSRTPGGVRPNSGTLRFGSIEFQFTHPGRGATPLLFYTLPPYRSFNSRTPGGVRLGFPLGL